MIDLACGPVFHIDMINLKLVCLVKYTVYLGQHWSFCDDGLLKGPKFVALNLKVYNTTKFVFT